MERASRVCRVCKARKKGCDRQMPRCGYCASRNLVCNYDDLPAIPSGSVAVGTISDLLACTTAVTLDDMLNLQVCHVIQRTGLSIHETSERFFRYFHSWLPVISPALFHEAADKFQPGIPPADFSVLLLAMYLIALHPSGDVRTPQTQPVYPEELWLTVKMFLGHVQALICASTRLVQASILIAAYEYACGRLDAADLSIGTCARMASILGIHRRDKGTNQLLPNANSIARATEAWNVWWGVIILERCHPLISNSRQDDR